MDLRGKTILIADDELEILELVAGRFESAGAAILTASDGLSAWELLNSRAIDLVISDMQMPGEGGGGLELLARIRDRDPVYPPFILMSGNITATNVAELPPGIVGVLPKPFSFRQLDALVKKILLGTADEGVRAGSSLTA